MGLRRSTSVRIQNKFRSDKNRQFEPLEPRILLARDVSGTLLNDDTWSDTVRVTSDYRVGTDAKLTIEPGTVVKIANGATINIDGSIDAQANAAQKIIFTSLQDDSVGEDLNGPVEGVPLPGDWEAIFINGSSGSNFNHVEIRYAGDQTGPTWNRLTPALHLSADGDATRIQNTTITNSRATGMHIKQGTPELTNVHIAGSVSSSAIVVNPAAKPAFSGITGGDNKLNHIAIEDGSFAGSYTLDSGGTLPFLLSNYTVQADETLTIVPGTVLKF